MISRRYLLSLDLVCRRGLIDLHVRGTGNCPPCQPAEMYVYRPPSAGDRLRPNHTGDKLGEDRLLGHRALRHVCKPAAQAIRVAHILLARRDDLGPKALHALLRAYFAYFRHGARDAGDSRRSRFSCLARLRFAHAPKLALKITHIKRLDRRNRLALYIMRDQQTTQTGDHQMKIFAILATPPESDTSIFVYTFECSNVKRARDIFDRFRGDQIRATIRGTNEWPAFSNFSLVQYI